MAEASAKIAQALEKIKIGTGIVRVGSKTEKVVEVSEELAKQLVKQKGFEELAAKRAAMGLPKAGAADDAATLAKLKIGGEEFEGINSGLQNPRTKINLKANAQTKTHAEAEAVQKAINASKKGSATEAEMWTDRDACQACGKYNGIGSLARELGVVKITVHSPSGTNIYYLPKIK